MYPSSFFAVFSSVQIFSIRLIAYAISIPVFYHVAEEQQG